jgi:hypothetical protein
MRVAASSAELAVAPAKAYESGSRRRPDPPTARTTASRATTLNGSPATASSSTSSRRWKSVENLELLRRGDVSLAFVRGGTASEDDRRELPVLGSLFLEPVWCSRAARRRPID